MSLIGYFLLKNILDTNANPTAGRVLDLLDEQVTETLRQGTGDSSSKDGMDVSLCKIDLTNNTLEYAGAHRPLYYVDINKNSVDSLDEIKGDKFPIGGAQYRNRTEFTNTLIQYNKGDMVFLFSDGLPDQFGGPDNRKFSPKRIRDTIKINQNEKMSDISLAIEKELVTWMKGDDIKQTDDILMIGIRF
jgi:serine phosphatase RsbU (regulator of sigma subunit)